jgi:hypothetical protein
LSLLKATLFWNLILFYFCFVLEAYYVKVLINADTKESYTITIAYEWQKGVGPNQTFFTSALLVQHQFLLRFKTFVYVGIFFFKINVKGFCVAFVTHKSDVELVFTYSCLQAGSCLGVICVCLRIHIVLCFLCCFSSSCEPYAASFSDLSICDCLFSSL